MSALPRLLVHLASGQWCDVPADDDWLSADERLVLAALKLEKRRNDWRLGRWLARRAILAAIAQDVPGLSIIAAAEGAPEVHGAPVPVTLSISHRHGRGLAGAATGAARIGCDLELIEPRSERFITDWLTPGESARILAAPEGDRALLANLCWSAKEAATKVLRVGLRFDTRSFDVALPEADALASASDWQAIAVTAVKTSECFEGVWRSSGEFVEVVLAETAFEVRE